MRVYLERYEAPDGELNRTTFDALARLIAAAETVAGITERTGRDEPSVVT